MALNMPAWVWQNTSDSHSAAHTVAYLETMDPTQFEWPSTNHSEKVLDFSVLEIY